MRRLNALALAFGLVACDNVDGGLVFEFFALPDDDDCGVSADNDALLAVSFDPMFQGDLLMFPVVGNAMAPVNREFLTDDDNEWPASTTVRVNSYEHTFQCDDSVFAGAPPMFLPLFGSSSVPFCQDPRDTDSAFQGFDVVAVDSGTIVPGARAPLTIKVVNGELGRGFEEMFVLAVASDSCCRGQSSDLCAQGQFDSIDGSVTGCDTMLDAINSGRLPPSEVETVRAYAKFDRLYEIDGVNAWIGSGYSLRVLGNFIGLTAGGRTVTSNEASMQIELNPNVVRSAFNAAPTVEDRQDIVDAFRCFSNFL